MSRITALRAPFRGSRRREIFLDGEKWEDTSVTVVREIGIAEGDDVDPAALLEQVLAYEADAARERALRLLGYREHGCQELRRKLLDDGYHLETATALCASLVRTGLVDDTRFASMLSRTLIDGRRLGRTRARREMLSRGLTEDTVDHALDECCDVANEYDRAVEVARRWYRPGMERKRLAARLLRRGYSASVSFGAAASVCDDEASEF